MTYFIIDCLLTYMLFHFFFNWQLSEKSVNDEGFVVFNFRQFHEFPKINRIAWDS